MQALASVCLRSLLLLEPASLIDKTLSVLFGGTGHLNICQCVVDHSLESLQLSSLLTGRAAQLHGFCTVLL